MIRTPKKANFIRPSLRYIPFRPICVDLQSKAERRVWKKRIERYKKGQIPRVKKSVAALFRKEGSAVAAAHKDGGMKAAKSAISKFTPQWAALLETTWLQVGSNASKVVRQAHIRPQVEKVPSISEVTEGWQDYVNDNVDFDRKASAISDTTIDRMTKAVAIWGAATSSVENEYAKMEEGRAKTIAMTEVNGATNYASMNVASMAGVAQKEWICMMMNSRDWHIEANGQTVGIDEKFIVMDEEMDCPGDDSASPENLINCMCDMTYSTEGGEEKEPEEEPTEEEEAPKEEPAEEAPTEEEPKEEQPTEAPTEEPEVPVTEEQKEVASTLHSDGVDMEPENTAYVKELGDATGGRIIPEDLEFSVKSEDSLARKIRDKQIDNPDLTPLQASKEITDLSRYTLVYDNENFTESVLASHEQLNSDGYTLFKAKNYLGSTEDYRAYNTVWEKDGNKIEIQYHTDETRRIKNENTNDYHIYRSTVTPDAEKEVIKARMSARWEGWTPPEGYEKLIDKRPPT